MGRTHGSCLKRNRIEGVYSMWGYGGLMRIAIHKLKYNFSYDLCGEICEAFLSEFNTSLFAYKSVVIVSIPLSSKRARWRGFNQSEILGKTIAKGLGWEYLDILERKTQGRTQVGLSRTERRENVKGVYKLKEAVLGKYHGTIIVFDDVVTTGSTLIEVGETIKKNGVERVWGMSLVR